MKITSRGKDYEWDLELFSKNGFYLLFGSNGQGKSSIAAAFKCLAINEYVFDEEEKRLKDFLGNKNKKENIAELKTYIKEKGRKIFVINNKYFNLKSEINDESNTTLIIQENAQEIQKLKNEQEEFSNIVNTKNSPVKKMLLKTFEKKEIINKITKEFEIEKGKFLFEKFSQPEQQWNNEWNHHLYKHYSSQIEVEKSIKILINILQLISKSRDSVAKEEKLFLNELNIEGYEELCKTIKKHKKHWKNFQECPFCNQKINVNKRLQFIKDEIEQFKNSNKQKILILKKDFDASPLPNIIVWKTLLEIDEDYINDVKTTLKNLKTIKYEEIIAILFWQDKEISQMLLKHKRLTKLKEKIPKINEKFKEKFQTFFEEIIVFDQKNIKASLNEDKKSIVIKYEKQKEGSIHEYLSTSMVNLLSLGFQMIRAQQEKKAIIVLDDPTNSNDILHLKYTAKKIMDLSTPNNSIILLTHDINLISEIREIIKQPKNTKIGTLLEEKSNKKINVQTIGELKEFQINYIYLFQTIQKEKNIALICIFTMLTRYWGKYQKVIKDNCNREKYIKTTHKSYFEGTSIVMHYFEFENKDLIQWFKKMLKIFGIEKNIKDFSYLEKVENSKDLINKLQKTELVGNFEPIKIIISNMLAAINLRIEFEQSLQKIESYNVQTNFKDSKKHYNFYKAGEPKHFQGFFNKYGSIMNKILHTSENDFYKFVNINKHILESASKKLKNLNKTIENKLK